MSRAFVKEDVDPPEPSGRKRSASGLPPGAVNYITASGAGRLRAELEKLRRSAGDHAERIAGLREILETLAIVEPPDEPGKSVAFGARVTVHDPQGDEGTYRIVGVEELAFYPDAVSWISPIGKALLIASLNERVTLDESGPVRVVKIEYPAD
ncbi:MAG: GreA/GreB family elongation factor [Chthoniobacterales bacterium]